MFLRPVLLSDSSEIESRYQSYFEYAYLGSNLTGSPQQATLLSSQHKGSLHPGEGSPTVQLAQASLMRYYNLPGRSRKRGLALHQQLMRQRGAVVCNALLIAPSAWDTPYLVYWPETPLFSLAAIWEERYDGRGSFKPHYQVLSQPANALFQAMGLREMPLILHRYQERRWLREEQAYRELTSILQTGLSPGQLNAYPVGQPLLHADICHKQQLKPAGQRLRSEQELQVRYKLVLEGMGGKRRRRQPFVKQPA